MAKNQHLMLLAIALHVVIAAAAIVSSAETNSKYVFGKKLPGDYCVVQGSAEFGKMQGFLDFACSHLDCRDILPGGDCFDPNTLPYHTSWALNKLYQTTRVCNFDIGFITTVDPSYNSCTYY